MNDRKLETIKRNNERENLDDVLRCATTFGITSVASTVLDSPVPLYFGTVYIGAKCLGDGYRLYKHYMYKRWAKKNLRFKR